MLRMFWRWLPAVWFVLALPAVAAASPSYSLALRRAFELPCDPSCSVCHTQPEGGFASANTKLGITLRRKFDLECCDVPALESVLPGLEQMQIDSDADGASDAEELRAMRDPNVPDPTGQGDAGTALACQPPAKDSGCSSARGGSAAGWHGAWLCCALLLLRRSVRSRPRAT